MFYKGDKRKWYWGTKMEFLPDKPLFMYLERHTFATTITLSNCVPLKSVGKMIWHAVMKNLMMYAKIVNTTMKKNKEGLIKLF